MKKTNNFYLIIIIALCISCLSISVGFSAMSTSLSINGGASFEPVGMIRVLSFEQNDIFNVVEHNSSHNTDSISVLLDINGSDGYATYNVNITNLGEIDKELSEIENEIFSNEEMEYVINGLELGSVIKAKESVNFTITFKYKNETVTSNRLNAKIRFKFEDYIKVILDNEYYKADGECLFGGKGVNVIGECNKGENADYIKTNITPFSSENYTRNFILKFKIKEINPASFTSGKRDTIFNILYEADDSVGKYPGLLLRIEGNRWMMQGSSGRGSNYANKVYFGKDELVDKEIKIIRHNDNGVIKLYYVIGDADPVLLKDISDLSSTFDTPLTFGASLAIDNVTSERHANMKLEDMLFEYLDDGLSLNAILGINPEPEPDPEPEIPTQVFSIPGPCIFSGSKTPISGECSTYNNELYINTNIGLFNSENYQKDFDLSFDLSNYTSNNQEVAQATIVNAFLERSGKGYGFLLRRSKDNLSFIVRDGSGLESEIILSPNNVSSFRVVRKNSNVCYSVNGGELIYVLNTSNLSAPFNTPLTLGGSIDINQNPFRYIKGTLSNIQLTMGNIGDVTCQK